VAVGNNNVRSSFVEGVAGFIPELWLMDHYDVQLGAPYLEELVSDLEVLTS
jgi:hypothetical protein